MKVTFIKEHPSGIPEGAEKDLTAAHAARLEKAGFVSVERPDPMSPNAPDAPAVDLTKKTKAGLEAMLTENGIEFEPGKLKKEELIAKLTPAE